MAAMQTMRVSAVEKINHNPFHSNVLRAHPSQLPQPMVSFGQFPNSPGLALSGVPNYPWLIRVSIQTFQGDIL
jgi:hypothetical protein